jgi:AcrR family transcriptional regulator
VSTEISRPELRSEAESLIPRRVSRSDDTRLALLRAAERLFAARGVEAVSLREVSVAGGQRNHSAAQYHFITKEGLVDALLERHALPLQEAWSPQLDAFEKAEQPLLRDIVALMVRPIAAKLDDPDGGREYILLSAELVGSPTLPLMLRPVANAPNTQRLIGLVLRFVEVPEELFVLRMQRVAATLYHSIAAYARQQDVGGAPPREMFVEDLIDSLTALVAA